MSKNDSSHFLPNFWTLSATCRNEEPDFANDVKYTPQLTKTTNSPKLKCFKLPVRDRNISFFFFLLFYRLLVCNATVLPAVSLSVSSFWSSFLLRTIQISVVANNFIFWIYLTTLEYHRCHSVRIHNVNLHGRNFDNWRLWSRDENKSL